MDDRGRTSAASFDIIEALRTFGVVPVELDLSFGGLPRRFFGVTESCGSCSLC